MTPTTPDPSESILLLSPTLYLPIIREILLNHPDVHLPSPTSSLSNSNSSSKSATPTSKENDHLLYEINNKYYTATVPILLRAYPSPTFIHSSSSVLNEGDTATAMGGVDVEVKRNGNIGNPASLGWEDSATIKQNDPDHPDSQAAEPKEEEYKTLKTILSSTPALILIPPHLSTRRTSPSPSASTSTSSPSSNPQPESRPTPSTSTSTSPSPSNGIKRTLKTDLDAWEKVKRLLLPTPEDGALEDDYAEGSDDTAAESTRELNFILHLLPSRPASAQSEQDVDVGVNPDLDLEVWKEREGFGFEWESISLPLPLPTTVPSSSFTEHGKAQWPTQFSSSSSGGSELEQSSSGRAEEEGEDEAGEAGEGGLGGLGGLDQILEGVQTVLWPQMIRKGKSGSKGGARSTGDSGSEPAEITSHGPDTGEGGGNSSIPLFTPAELRLQEEDAAGKAWREYEAWLGPEGSTSTQRQGEDDMRGGTSLAGVKVGKKTSGRVDAGDLEPEMEKRGFEEDFGDFLSGPANHLSSTIPASHTKPLTSRNPNDPLQVPSPSDNLHPSPDQDQDLNLDLAPILTHLQSLRHQLSNVTDEDERRRRAGREVERILEGMGLDFGEDDEGEEAGEWMEDLERELGGLRVGQAEKGVGR